jgi:predicted enzyme related to lactoylglutathione lyase
MKSDDRMNPDKNPMPFDGARMIFGGFAPVVTLEKPAATQPGDFIWYELLTADADAAQRFYGPVLGWTFSDSGQPDMDYRFASTGQNGVAGFMAITKDMADHGARPAWLTYVAVDDVDAAVADIRSRGGAVLMGAMDIPMVGRIAMVADPQGAPFYVMKPQGSGKSLAFAYDRPRPGHCAWNELRTPDQTAAWDFYGALFGWRQDGEMDMGPLGQYQFIRNGDGMAGAMMPSAAAKGPPQWNPYFRVEDIDVAKSAVEAGGGTVVQGPDQIPGGDFSMNCIDPQGAGFGLVGGRRQGQGT